MVATNRFNFVPGRQPSASYFNRVQDPPRFDGIDRLDAWNPDELRAAWGINQRDGIKDWEIDTRLGLGRLVWGGLVKGADIDPLSNLRLSSTIGRPNVYRTTSTPVGFVNVEIYGGSIVNTQGAINSWGDLELTIADDAISFAWVDTAGIVQVGSALPSQTQVFTPLFRINVVDTAISEFEDLRPGLRTGYQPTNYFVLLNTPVVSDDYTASSWERVLVDATLNTFIVFLPATPNDGDLVAVLDVIGNVSVNQVLVNPNGSNINQNSAPYVVNSDFSHIVFVYSESEGSWYIQSTNTEGGAGSGSTNIFPLGYKLVSVDYAIQDIDYRYWIDSDSTISTRIITLPTTGLEFGFECYVQSIGGSTVFFTAGDIDSVTLNLSPNEVAHLYWLDNSSEGGTGVWKAQVGLASITGGTGGEPYVEINSIQAFPIATGTDSIAIGPVTSATELETIAFGIEATASEEGAIAFGTRVNAPAFADIVFGYEITIDLTTANDNITALGSNFQIDDGSSNSTIVGTGNNLLIDGVSETPSCVIVGNANTISGASLATALGTGLTILVDSNESVNLGFSNVVGGANAVSVGSVNDIQNIGVAIGTGVVVSADNGTGIGTGAEVTAADAVQLGTGTNSTASTLQFLTSTLANSFGIQALTSAGVPTAAAPNGTLGVDTTNNGLYFRSNSTWFPGATKNSNEETLAATKTLVNTSEIVQVLDPNGVARDVVLPDPPNTNVYFEIINNSDGLSGSGNTLNIKETAAGAVVVTLDDTTGELFTHAHYTGANWIYYR